LWGVGLLVVGAFLMAGHLLSLPVPSATDRRLHATLAAEPTTGGRWTAHHVLYRSCGCSDRVLSHLLERKARGDLVETVVYVHDGGPADSNDLGAKRAELQRAGFGFEPLTPDELEQRYRMESAPSLLVADASGTVRYAGGYTDRSGGTEISDVAIIERLKSGADVKALPVFGCAVSGRLQQALDPLGLKYKRGIL
jgi:hypothetical protein